MSHEEDSEEKKEYSPTVRGLAQAVLLFHSAGIWTDTDAYFWYRLTGDSTCTTKSLCDYARKVIDDEDAAVRQKKGT